jgi:hypothetical protein
VGIQEIPTEHDDLRAQCKIVDSWREYISDGRHPHQLNIVQVLVDLNVELWNALDLGCSFDDQADLDLSLFKRVIDFRHLADDFVKAIGALSVNLYDQALSQKC